MKDVDLKKIINDNSIDILFERDLDENVINSILDVYLEIIDEINKEYNEKTKKLVKVNNVEKK